MNHVAAAKELLDTMLGYLGFVVTIEVDTTKGDAALLVTSAEGDLLIGEEGARLDDIQYLLNRVLQARDETAPRIRVDVNHYRSMSDHQLIEEAETLALRVIHSGKAMKLRPLNSYHRRIIHTHFLNHPGIKTWSPKDEARLKRIHILPRNQAREETGS